jgi:hypothetical protein
MVHADSNQGGILHYDMGKCKDDGIFHIESHLNKPPKILLKAIKLLQSDYDFGVGEMKQYIDEVATKSTKPGLEVSPIENKAQQVFFYMFLVNKIRQAII